MIKFEFDPDELRNIIREEIRTVIREELNNAKINSNVKELPPMLTRNELKEFLKIKETKASELLNRPDFPVLREAGILIPTHLLMQWIEDNTQWVNFNSKQQKR